MVIKYSSNCLYSVLISSILLVFLTLPQASAQEVEKKPSLISQEKKLKTKLAVGRFSNETNYGISLLRDGDLDPLGKQAADILTAYLTKTNNFLIFERPDLSKIKREQNQSGQSQNIVGVDTLILGSIVEFGRTTDGQRGLFNKKKVQVAHAKVAIRLVDVRTGLVFHSATGEGEATTESSTVLGMGSTSKYDATLNDKAISIAIEDMIEELITTLSGRRWKTDILQVENGAVYISGGQHQGLQQGDHLIVMKEGKTIRSNQSGFDITLPAEKVAEILIETTFGDSETNEGSVARIVSGTLENGRPAGFFVTDQ
ncbi:CsgG/HfaB family protein [Emcibacter sp.]|uniref:CsgG/HfaB family protein n=1 Tax=Emcibacter sp. TaxID=1979954 RepID=UPI002AA82BDA|nr:CsgG/HfaB family protein [Emcibacter sp.]